MRFVQILGIVLIAFGAYVLVRGFSFETKDKVVDLGDVEAHVDKRQTIPPWAGAIIGGVGVMMVVAGGRRRRV
jgi:hypothetical protein